MQHDVYANPGPRTRLSRPFLTVLQADVVGSPVVLVCPLIRAAALPPSRTAPAVRVSGDDFVVAIAAMFPVGVGVLGRPLGSIALFRDDIVRALDWLFTGL